MADEQTEALVIFKGDASNVIKAAKEANTAIASIRQTTDKEFAALRENASAALISIEKTNKNTTASILAETEKVGRQKYIDSLAKDYAFLASEIGNSVTEAKNLAEELTKIGATDDEIEAAASTFARFQGGGGQSGVGGQSGSIDSGLSATAGVLSSVGAGGASELVRLTSDINQFVEQLPQMAAGFGSLLLTTGPLIIAAGAVAVAFSLFTQRQQEAAAAAKAYADQITTDATRQVELTRLIEAGDQKGIQAKLDSAQAEKELQAAILEDAFAKLNAAQAAKDLEASGEGLSKQWQEGKITWEDYIQKLEDQDTAIAGANQAIEAQLPIYEKARDEVNKLSEAMTSSGVGQLNHDVDTFNSALDGLSGVLDANTIASLKNADTTEERTNALIQAENQLATQRKTQIDTIQSLNDQENALNAQWNQQQLQSIVDRQRAGARLEEDYARQEERRNEDLNRSLEQQQIAHGDRLIDIQDRGNDQIEKAQTELTKSEIKANEDRAKVQEEFAKNSLELDTKYESELSTIKKKFADDRRRIEEEADEARKQAIGDQDVRAFIAANDAEKKGLADIREQRKSDKADLKKELEEERQKVYENYQERIEQIDSEIQKQREATAVRIAEINTQTQAAIDSENKTYENRLALDEETRRIQSEREQQDRDRMETRRVEDFQRQYDRQVMAHNQAIANLDAQEEKQLAVYYNVDTALTNLLDKSQQLATITGGASGGLGVNTLPPVTALPPVNPQSLSGGQSVNSGGVSVSANVNVGTNSLDTNTVNDIVNEGLLHIAQTLDKKIQEAQR